VYPFSWLISTSLSYRGPAFALETFSAVSVPESRKILAKIGPIHLILERSVIV